MIKDDIISTQELSDMLKDAGLDFSSDDDYQHWVEATKAYTGDNLRRDLNQVVHDAATKKKLASAGSLDDYFKTFREDLREKASKNTPKPQPKTNAEKTTTEGLNDYFAEFRKKQGY